MPIIIVKNIKIIGAITLALLLQVSNNSALLNSMWTVKRVFLRMDYYGKRSERT